MSDRLSLDELITLGAKLANARQEESIASRDVHKAIVKYCSAGWTKTEVADALGISRQTVYNVLEGTSS